MNAKELIRLPDPRENVRVEVREVVRDVFSKPHVFIRVRLTGWYFPGRAPEPFMVIGDVVSKVVIIDPDGRGANAYFDQPLPRADRVSFGYGKIINWDFNLPINPERMPRLDRVRLPKDVIDQLRRSED
jgi:hypothetical protein